MLPGLFRHPRKFVYGTFRSNHVGSHELKRETTGTVGEGLNDSHGALGGTVGGPFPTNMGAWLFVMVSHQMKDYVALPFCPEDDPPASDAINVVDMLSEQEAVGRNLDKTQLTTANIGSWSNDLRIIRKPMDGESRLKED